MDEGAYDYMAKLLNIQRFQALVAENHELRLRLRRRSEPNLQIGQSEAMLAVSRLVDGVAQGDMNILVEGESEINKGIVARSIRLKRGCRATAPSTPVLRPLCAA